MLDGRKFVAFYNSMRYYRPRTPSWVSARREWKMSSHPLPLTSNQLREERWWKVVEGENHSPSGPAQLLTPFTRQQRSGEKIKLINYFLLSSPPSSTSRNKHKTNFLLVALAWKSCSNHIARFQINRKTTERRNFEFGTLRCASFLHSKRGPLRMSFGEGIAMKIESLRWMLVGIGCWISDLQSRLYYDWLQT